MNKDANSRNSLKTGDLSPKNGLSMNDKQLFNNRFKQLQMKKQRVHATQESERNQKLDLGS